jgi:hypothetical protein
MDTLIIERQWDSFAAMEAAYEKVIADPDYQQLQVESVPITRKNRFERYLVLE